MVKNGVSYAITSSKNVVSLKLAVAPGKIKIGKATAEKFTGTANSGIFYGGKGNDKIYGRNGRDVAVFDKSNWTCREQQYLPAVAAPLPGILTPWTTVTYDVSE